MLSGSIRDLHESNPGLFITDVSTGCREIFEHSPYITDLSKDPEAEKIKIQYPIVHECNEGAYHFVHGYAKDMENRLGVKIHVKHLKGDIHISNEEKSWISQVKEIMNINIPYWIIDAGCKSDYTAKHWCPGRFQQVVDDNPQITFVQIGKDEADHYHPSLIGDNLINLVGQTDDLRKLIRLVYHSYGVISPVSLPMHLAAAIEPKLDYGRRTRPCIVLAGGREPSHWEAYTNHAYLHTCGKLPCCDNGGCWKSRTVPLGDGAITEGMHADGTPVLQDESLCEFPVESEYGYTIPKCLEMITADDVSRHLREYMEWERLWK